MHEKQKRKRQSYRPRVYIFMGILIGIVLFSGFFAFFGIWMMDEALLTSPANGMPDNVTATRDNRAEFAPASTVVANRLYSVASSPTSDDIVVVGWDNGMNQLRLLSPSAEDTLNGDVVPIPIDNNEMYNAVQYSLDGAYLAMASQALNRIDIYDAQSLSFVNHIQGVYTLAYSPDGTSLAVAGNSGNILIFDPSGTQLQNTIELEQTVFALAYSPDSAMLAVAYYENGVSHVTLYDSENASRYPAFYTSGNNVYALDFHPSGNILAVATDDNVQVIYINEGDQRFYPLEILGRVRDVVFSPDGRYLVASGGETGSGKLGQIMVWSLSEDFTQSEILLRSSEIGNYRYIVGHAHDVNSIVFTAPNRLLSAGSDGTLRLWDIDTGLEISFMRP